MKNFEFLRLLVHAPSDTNLFNSQNPWICSHVMDEQMTYKTHDFSLPNSLRFWVKAVTQTVSRIRNQEKRSMVQISP